MTDVMLVIQCTRGTCQWLASSVTYIAAQGSSNLQCSKCLIRLEYSNEREKI